LSEYDTATKHRSFGRPPKLTNYEGKTLIKVVAKRPTVTLKELQSSTAVARKKRRLWRWANRNLGDSSNRSKLPWPDETKVELFVPP